MIIAVGSTNPTKLEAVELAFKQIWPGQPHKIVAVDVASGVADQPLSDNESIKGAKTRATKAIDGIQAADFGVGIEGGLHQVDDDWFERSWSAVVNHQGKHGVGASPSFWLPPAMVPEIMAGKNLNDACEIFFDVKDVGKAQGFFGLMTQDAITRTTGSRDSVITALSAFIHPKLFHGE